MSQGWILGSGPESVLRAWRENARELVVGFLVVLGIGLLMGLVEPSHFVSPSLRGAIESLIAMWAIVAGGLLVWHFNHTRARRDLLLLAALAGAASADFLFLALPAFADGPVLGRGTGARVGAELLVAVAFAAAALLPDRKVEGAARKPVIIAAAVGVGVIACGWAIDHVVGSAEIGNTGRAGLAVAAGHPFRFALTLVSSELLLVAGMAILVRGRRGYAESHLLAGAAFLLCAARLQFLAMPSGSLEWVTPREGMRLAAYALLLVVAARQYAAVRRDGAREAVEAERQRIARDLHDGLAQDLAFIASHSQLLTRELGSEHPVAVAARRALAVSRGAIIDLSASDAPNTEAALGLVVDELRGRFDVNLQLTVREERRELPASEREDVLRIAREAIVNAVKHGGATKVDVLLDTSGEGPLLRVLDNGRGMSEDAPAGGSGFGLPTMRIRAAALGARLVTRTVPRGGTELLVL